MRYATIVTKSRVKCTVSIIWTTSFLLSYVHFRSEHAFHIMVAFVTGFCLVISTFCYIRIYGIVRQHHSQLLAQRKAVDGSDTKSNMHMVRLIQSAINTLLFYIVLVICYFPMDILSILHGTSQGWKTELDFAYTVVFMNSSINPFLFCWRLQEVRAAVIKTGKQMLC